MFWTYSNGRPKRPDIFFDFFGGWFFDNPDGGNAPGDGGGGGGRRLPRPKQPDRAPGFSGRHRRRPPGVRDYIIRSLMETSQPAIMSYGGHDRNKATLPEEPEDFWRAAVPILQQKGRSVWESCLVQTPWYWCHFWRRCQKSTKIECFAKSLLFVRFPRNEREDISVSSPWGVRKPPVQCRQVSSPLSHSGSSCQWLTLPACQLLWGCCLTTHRASCME